MRTNISNYAFEVIPEFFLCLQIIDIVKYPQIRFKRKKVFLIVQKVETVHISVPQQQTLKTYYCIMC